MLFRDVPIQKKLMRILLLLNGIILFVTCVTFFIYEVYIFRKTMTDKISTIGKIIAVNSTAALAFRDQEAAAEILSALKTENHITHACLYDKDGKLFFRYPATGISSDVPAAPGIKGYIFTDTSLEGFEPILQEKNLQGTLYLKSDLGTMKTRLRSYAIIVASVIIVSFVLAYLLSKILQKSIADPILSLAKTASHISIKKDYSVRATKAGQDELGLLTDSFNEMVEQIEEQNRDLSEFNHTLEEKIKHRTLELEKANNEMEAFSYSISHDLRAPLRGILGFTGILEEDYASKLDDEARRITGVIKESTLKMGQLVDDLLAFSRMSRQDIKKNNFSTNELVKEIVKSLGAGHTTITWQIASLPNTYGDINTLRQVWINFISNAIKYSGNVDRPHIEIGSFSSNGQSAFFVKDNGVGFDPEYMHKLFKVFQRLHTSNEFEGTGVGLAIVEKIISKHGGKVWAEAEKNIGACFYFSLPGE